MSRRSPSRNFDSNSVNELFIEFPLIRFFEIEGPENRDKGEELALEAEELTAEFDNSITDRSPGRSP